ncbi:MAG: hypothetical protein H0T11_00825 [Chthoniobacterales bacterium]|nr:hypothetical protein [Chthoniobacterales bacterium]
MEQVAENLWVPRYPLGLLGVEIGRTVTIVRLKSGKLVIHSTAPFTSGDVAQISSLGEPAWLLDATTFHDSFAEQGRRVFSTIPYLVPEGFPGAASLNAQPLHRSPDEWTDELEVLPVGGVPRIRENVMFHVPSRTLVVADLLFNFGQKASGWTKFFARYVMRLKDGVGTSPFFRSMIRDRAAFEDSIRKMLSCDIERIIVAHGEMIERDPKQHLERLLSGRPIDSHGC